MTRKTRNLGYENRVKVIKHDFQNPLSCKEDNEGLTKTLREDKETSVRQPGPLKTTMLVQTKMHTRRSTGERRHVSVCIVLTDRYQTYCKRLNLFSLSKNSEKNWSSPVTRRPSRSRGTLESYIDDQRGAYTDHLDSCERLTWSLKLRI